MHNLNPNKTKVDVNAIGLCFVTKMDDYVAASDMLIANAGPDAIAEATTLDPPAVIAMT